MSASHRHTSICGIAVCRSEKEDKRIANQKLRRAVHLAIHRDDDVMPDLREVSDVWCMGKDGKQFFDERRHPELMRK